MSVPVFSLGLAAVLLLISFSFSGTNTVWWNGEPCLAGTQYGFPLPFMYFMSRSSNTSPLLHSSAVCTSVANVEPIRLQLSNAVVDYLFWFAFSLPIILGLALLLARKPVSSEKKEVPLSSEIALPGT
jgi:hypothetical protein